MTHRQFALATATAAAISLSLVTTPARAAVDEYRFDLIGVAASRPGETDVLLRLVHTPDSKAVPGAIIFGPRAVMAGMENMPGTATVEPGQQPGTYLLHVATSMAGPWTLQLSSKIQGETGTLRASVPFEAGK